MYGPKYASKYIWLHNRCITKAKIINSFYFIQFTTIPYLIGLIMIWFEKHKYNAYRSDKYIYGSIINIVHQFQS